MAEAAFREAERAQHNLEAIRSRVPPAIAGLLPTLLAESPDPDGALNLFERLCREADDELFRLFQRHPALVHYALAIFGYSQYLGETLIQNTDLFHALAREKTLDRSQSREDFEERLGRLRSRSLETDAALLLARFKRREYIRIMLRDVLGIAALADVTAEISALSDVLIEAALAECSLSIRNRFGAPQRVDAENRLTPVPFTVLSLGKLGGNELNYNSDVDLLFLFGNGESPPDAQLPLREYFIRLAQMVTETLSRPTREGPVFRIDLRLRPQGNEGEPAIALGHALKYYEHTAHDWELQVLIKARRSAGDSKLAREFIRGVQARVYRTGLNFAAIETAWNSLGKISERRRSARALHRSQQGIDVKVDAGGIRDIEFLVQCLQRVYGGEEPWLRSGGTLFSLQKLHDKNHLSGKDFFELNQAYEFLRRLEHRLQLRRGQQTHRLPEGAELEVIARGLGNFPGIPAIATGEELVKIVEQMMSRVAAIYQRTIHAQQQVQQREQAAKEFALQPAPHPDRGREDSFDQVLHRLSADSPALYEVAARHDLSSRSRRYLHRFLNSALTSSERYAAVLRHPRAMEKVLSVFEVSDYLADVLIRHPDEIATVEDISSNHQPDPTEWPALLASRPVFVDADFAFLHTPASSYAERLALLRRLYRHRIFAAGVTDVLSAQPVFGSLFATTAAADAAIKAALAIAQLESGQHEASEFALLALGRLGTQEFDFGSDADVLFVRSENSDSDPVASLRLAEQMVDILAAYTQEGTVFPVDARLRPRGAEGELVTTPAALAAYFGPSGDARAWEALSFVKLRYVAGSRSLAQRAIEAVSENLPRFRDSAEFLPQTLEMRARLAQADSARPERSLNFKTGEGGFYDIDFIASYLAVRHNLSAGSANIRERLHSLAMADLLTDEQCATLDYAAELLRTVDHVIRIVSGRARKSLPVAEHGREAVEHLTARVLDRSFPDGVEPELRSACAAVRDIYSEVMK